MMDNLIYWEFKECVMVKWIDLMMGFENLMYGIIGFLRMSEEEEEVEVSGFVNFMFIFCR